MQDGRDHAERSPGDDPRRGKSRAGVHDSSAPNARRNREDGHRADAAADELEQAGGGADSGFVPADALQQDEEARHQGPARGAARGRSLNHDHELSRDSGIRESGFECGPNSESRVKLPTYLKYFPTNSLVVED